MYIGKNRERIIEFCWTNFRHEANFNNFSGIQFRDLDQNRKNKILRKFVLQKFVPLR